MNKTSFKLAIILLIIVYITVLIAIIWGKNGIFELSKAKEKEERLQSEVKYLELENKKLKDEIEKYKNNPSLYEILAREKLFMKKKNEKVIYIIN